MSSSCMGKELPKEKQFGVKVCRERKCPELQKDPKWPDSPERCTVFNQMPGTLPCCIKDPEMKPEVFLKCIGEELHEDWERNNPDIKNPGPKNCPDKCPYKLSEMGEVFKKDSKGDYGKRPGKITRCGFTGEVLGGGGGICMCHVLGNPDQEGQIDTLKCVISAGFGNNTCWYGTCPDGIERCTTEDEICPVNRLPRMQNGCPLWRIPAKLLQAPAIEAAPKPTPEPDQNTEKPESPAERLARGKAIREEVLENRATMKRMSTGRSAQKEKKSPRALTQKEKTAEPEKSPAPEKKKKKPATDVPALNVLYLEDCESLTKRMEPESIDLIFTDPPYVTEPIDDDGVTQWERAYVALHLIASKVLKPSGYLITYAPQAHLHDIMDILAHGSSRKIMVNESGGELDYFWIIPSLNGGATCKAHKWNALCLHKPILVYQKAPFKSPSKCFADVIRGKKQKSYHAWQQSVHDVLGILSRFMEPGQIVYDPYACTATTLIAGQLLGMQYIGAEIDPKAHAIGVRDLQQRPMDLFTFGGEKPESVVREITEGPKDTSKQAAFEDPAKGARPVELHAACLECEAVDRCMRHDPRANCLQEFLDFEKDIEKAREPPAPLPKKAKAIDPSCKPCQAWGICKTHNKPRPGCSIDAAVADDKAKAAKRPKDAGTGGGPQPVQEGSCGTCGHHKGHKSFHESCPRIGELLFKKGDKSARVLMEETAARTPRMEVPAPWQ